MNTKFRDIQFPPTYQYSSDSDFIPLEFYENTFPIAKSIDLLLGYFSSNAFKILSKSFAEFIHNGGKMRIITNHIYSIKDKNNLIDTSELKDEDKVIEIFGNLETLEIELSGYGNHFFDCLKYLLKNKRLEIVPVKFNGVNLAHSKKMILYDGYDYISTDGSINFTLSALTRNSESFEVNAPWEGDIFKKRTILEKENFQKIFSREHTSYQYLEPNQIEVVINKVGKDKSIQDLLEDSLTIDKSIFGNKVQSILNQKRERFEYKINSIKGNPRFPFVDGARDYQIMAYENWIKSDYSGVFAMATGTGKTITSLNCLLQEYRKEKFYKAIILVPSIALLNQWEIEVQKFNFKNIIKVGGGNNWEKEIASLVSDYTWGMNRDILIIATYGSFSTDRFQKYFKKVEKSFTLIADEAHNMGANNLKKVFEKVQVKKRIGLSATPNRVYDPEGTDAINHFFNDEPPYIYNFSMSKALDNNFLTEYNYYPILVELSENELKSYIELSKKLLKFFDFEKGKYKKDPIVEILLLKRKNIIHKAENKLLTFKKIITELDGLDKLKYAFTYVPEGNITNEDGTINKLIDLYIQKGDEAVKGLKMNSYTSHDEKLEDIIRGFSEGKIDVLFAMKMLDEGVDVPRAEIGIFCSSTGNPRQFIQRRGRLLRKHKDKSHATIYDMVVVPKIGASDELNLVFEKNMVKTELQRVGYFASLSMNFYDSRENLDEICKKYELSLDEIIQELE